MQNWVVLYHITKDKWGPSEREVTVKADSVEEAASKAKKMIEIKEDTKNYPCTIISVQIEALYEELDYSCRGC